MQPAQADKTNSKKHLTERTMKCCKVYVVTTYTQEQTRNLATGY
ncbi:Uncharacterised protein [Streptococcus pneumoniae]|uniref:Uncharacterized protein n=1 Tax=Streptococcus pneumoniae TaxID=1313 RepID=A0AA87C647_STREE|nr:Uncharacterised protein [Streptococcus pneumoniae]CIQ26470.1 Uncharacterised protein [Streptococcus pneumoniae]CIQ45628.1 Uncharacterised protein [Streptococcus pneumoniae]CIS75833.1 Uncharacterised protein [Streptococcus pneumoniae]CIZ14189.1 Uncharacterised protein [Streptococcus pneumoniae]